MTRDWLAILSEVVRIASRRKADFPRSCKEVLCFLSETLHLEEACLVVGAGSDDPACHGVTASGSALFQPLKQSGISLVSETIHPSGGPVRKSRQLQWVVPASCPQRVVLLLTFSPDLPTPSRFDDFVSAVSLQLAGLFDRWLLSDEKRHLALQAELFADLNRQLNKVRTVDSLLQAAGRSLRRHLGAAAVVVRPLLGGTVLGPPSLHLARAWQHRRSRVVAFEEKLAVRVISEGRPIDCQEKIVRRSGRGPGTSVSVTPLRLGQRIWGTLAVFDDQSVRPFSLTSERPGDCLDAVAMQIAQAVERVTTLEELQSLSVDNTRKLEEVALLYRISRAIHSTLLLDELMHLTLSAATAPGGAGFERAMLFMVNERSGILQGMLGVTCDTASMILPAGHSLAAWERPEVREEAREAQRQSPFCRQVMKLRLPLDAHDNPLARAVLEGRVVFVPEAELSFPDFSEKVRELGLESFACSPLLGRNRVLGVLLVDNPGSGTEITMERQRFLELFANQAAQAMENCLLLHRLEASHRDLRETQELMIQGEKMAALGETAASVTHELRNPLAAIGGFAQRLARIVAEGSREKEYSEIIVREVRRMEEMLSNILAFSRKQMLCVGDCRIETLIEEALALEQDSLVRSGVFFRSEIAENLPAIRGDEQKLRQVLVNLITNARQSMSAGGTLTVRAHATTLRGDQAVAIEVEDTGGGIPADVMRNIFNPFFTTRQNGTGLGLSIVHRIIEHHNGDIEVQNREKGALFIVRLAVEGVHKALPFR
jgi:two-component system sensor histidine kinase HydH